MGKKSKILYFSILIVNAVFFVLDLLPLSLSFSFFNFSFGVSLILIGILLIIRSVTYKIDSSMFLGSVMLFCGALNLFDHIFYTVSHQDLTVQTIPYYLFGLAVSSLITALYFKAKIHFKLFILFMGFGFITLLHIRNLIPLWLMIVLMIVWFIGYFVVNILLAKRRDKNG